MSANSLCGASTCSTYCLASSVGVTRSESPWNTKNGRSNVRPSACASNCATSSKSCSSENVHAPGDVAEIAEAVIGGGEHRRHDDVGDHVRHAGHRLDQQPVSPLEVSPRPAGRVGADALQGAGSASLPLRGERLDRPSMREMRAVAAHVLIRAHVGVKEPGAAPQHVEGDRAADRAPDEHERRSAQARGHQLRQGDAVVGEALERQPTGALRALLAERLSRAGLVPLHEREVPLPAAQEGAEDRVRGPRAAVDEEQDRVSGVLAADADPLLEAAEVHEARLRDAGLRCSLHGLGISAPVSGREEQLGQQVGALHRSFPRGASGLTDE